MIRSPQRQLAPDTLGPEIDETTSLRGIADKARHDKVHRFGNLYGELNEVLLKEAWRRLNKSAASGIDRVTARDYERDLDANIKHRVGMMVVSLTTGASVLRSPVRSFRTPGSVPGAPGNRCPYGGAGAT